MEVIKKVVPYRIKQARVSRGLSMLDLSELIGTSKQAVSQYELGKNEPSKLVLNRIANILKYDVSFFYKPIPVNDKVSSPVFFRKKKSTKVKDVNAAKVKIEIFREIHDYLSQFVDFPQLNFPKINYDDDGIYAIDNDTIEEYALDLRKLWGLGDNPIDSLISVVQKNGIMVSKVNLKMDKLDAFSVWFDNKPFIFLGGNKETNARIRFDIAHELGHLLMHADYYTEDDITNKLVYDKLEDEANRFAGALLMPREKFKRDIFSTSIDHFIQVKSKWKSSISSMIRRCDSLGILSENQVKYLNNQMTIRAYWKQEPLDTDTPVEKPFVHKQAINLLLENNIISGRQFVEDIGCLPDELEQYCFLDKGTLTKDLNSSNVIRLKC